MVKSTKSFELTFIASLLLFTTLNPKHKFKSARDFEIFFLSSAGAATDHGGIQTCADCKIFNLTVTVANPTLVFLNWITQSAWSSIALTSPMFTLYFSTRKYLSKHTCAVGEARNN